MKSYNSYRVDLSSSSRATIALASEKGRTAAEVDIAVVVAAASSLIGAHLLPTVQLVAHVCESRLQREADPLDWRQVPARRMSGVLGIHSAP